MPSRLCNIAEPLSGLSHDFVDLERLQKGRLLFQLRTPLNQNPVRVRSLVIAFINNLLDGRFPFSETHRLFLFDFGIRGDVSTADSQTILYLPSQKAPTWKGDVLAAVQISEPGGSSSILFISFPTPHAILEARVFVDTTIRRWKEARWSQVEQPGLQWISIYFGLAEQHRNVCHEFSSLQTKKWLKLPHQ